MIEWLITDYHFIPTFFFVFLILFAVMSAAIMSKSAYANSFKLSDFALIAFLNLVISVMITFFVSVLILTLTSTKPVGSSEWKTIYDSTGSAAKTEIARSLSEDQKSSELAAAAIATNTGDLESNNVKIKISHRMSSVEAGNEIGERFADVFSNLTDHQSKQSLLRLLSQSMQSLKTSNSRKTILFRTEISINLLRSSKSRLGLLTM